MRRCQREATGNLTGARSANFVTGFRIRRQRISPIEIYQQLLRAYGPQHWWPADTPFEMMVGAILTQNTSWTQVEAAITQLKRADLLDAKAMLACPTDQLEMMIRSTGFFRQKALRLQSFCHFYLCHGGIDALQKRPDDALRALLLAEKGVGPETADSIMLYAFGRAIFVVDAYTRRIFSRLGLVSDAISYARLQSLFHTQLEHDPALFNEYHALIVFHAKHHCRTKPDCLACPLQEACPAAVVNKAPAPSPCG
ncbi:endonuclease III domain-containing protein [Mariprofundus erugo]|uniref:Endonuclease III domain-containing protein n=2 Tax=Mariprofundus erugo TaxID=2528639 RepID=A0A5R9GR94_9PROT|nr:endonuclease III domain-containing protein [Mariprofundus erugo]